MATADFQVQTRIETGKGAARRLRVKGLVPAVFYGPGAPAVMLACDPKELSKALRDHGMNTILTLKGVGGVEGKPVLVHDYQRDPVTRNVIHVDFLEIDLKKKVQVGVPIHLIGKAKGEEEGGIVDHIRHQIEVECLPTIIPDYINVDVSHLGINDAIHISDISVPSGVEILDEPGLTIVTVSLPSAAQAAVAEEMEAAEEAKAEAAEGAEAAEEGGGGEE